MLYFIITLLKKWKKKNESRIMDAKTNRSGVPRQQYDNLGPHGHTRCLSYGRLRRNNKKTTYL